MLTGGPGCGKSFTVRSIVELATAKNATVVLAAPTGRAARRLAELTGAVQSQAFATSWPNATAFIAVLRPLADHGNGRLLVEDPAIVKYYLPSGHQWRRWSSTRNIVLASGASTGTTTGIIAAGNAATFAYYIAHGYFAYVALNFTDTTGLDHGLATELHHNPRYHTIAVVPYGTEVKPVGLGTYVIWKYEPRR